MSRCFPFPPPGYVLNGTRDEAVIVSIKGAQEKAKKEQSRKERKDKKDKKDKKEKKEKKRKEREGKEGVSEKHSHKRRRKEQGAKDGPNQKVDRFHNLKESETNCLEKSSLTVERELLQSTSQNSCDSTLNSNEILPKQKEKQQPLDGRHNNNQKQKEKQQPLDVRHNNNNDSESIIRIRLPIRRQKDPEVMTNKDQEKPGPSRGIKFDSSQVATREPVNQHPCSTSAPEHPSKPREEKRKDPVFRGKLGKGKISSSSTPDTYQPRKSLCNCPPSMVLQFLNVVENWVPNTIERRVDLINSEDEECWWSKKKPSSPTEICNQLNRNSEIKPVSNSMGWPCARLLPEADVYALPYTVPF